MKSKLLPLLFTVLIFAGCVTPVPPKPASPTTAPFDASAFAPYMEKGTARISGQAFLKTMGGDVKTGAGCTIRLIPATAYMKEVISLKERGMSPSNHTQENVDVMMKAARSTVADADGRFEFTNLPAGEYSLETTIEWQYVNSGAYRSTTGGLVRKMITLGDGEALKIMLTR